MGPARLVIYAAVAALFVAPVARGDEPRWKAGAASVSITPGESMWMSGYASRDRPAEGKLTELWAKALAVEAADGRRLVLLTLDLVGIDRATADAIAWGLMERHGLERSQIAINCSHTHSGPVVGENLRPIYRLDAAQRERITRYTRDLVGRAIDVGGRAIADLSPARVEWGTGHASFAVNRRNNTEARVPELRASGQLVGPVDHDVPVLSVRDDEGRPRAVVFGYACHATCLSGYDWCGDYPGFAQAALEERYAGAVAMFWAGCGGDQNPLPRRTVELARRYGDDLAQSVARVLDAPMRRVEPTATARYTHVELPFASIPTREKLLEAKASPNGYESRRAAMLLNRLDADGAIPAHYRYPVQVWHLGDDVRWVFLGGEVVVDYALRIKSELGGSRVWVAGYSNDVMAYIPSERVLSEGGYEGGGAMVYYGLPSPWAPGVEGLIMNRVAELTR